MPRSSSLLLAALALLGTGGPVVLLLLVKSGGGDGSAGGATTGQVIVVAAGLSAGAALTAAALWQLMRRRIIGPSRALARDLRTLTQARRVDRDLRDIGEHELGDLPSAVGVVVDDLRGARREMVRAMATATERTAQEKGWLEHILLELVPQGVIVCNLDHQVLLYNQAASSLFADQPVLGLGRSLSSAISLQPLEHALERLELMLKGGRTDTHLTFVCESATSARLLESRIALVLDAQYGATGYALSLEDISADFEHRRSSALIERAITRDIRGPLGSLRAAAEMLAREDDLPAEQRRAFLDVLVNEGEKLSGLVDRIAELSEQREEGGWPMSDVHSADLLSLLSDRLQKSGGREVDVVGDTAWLAGDSHLLLAVLFDLANALGKDSPASPIRAEAGTRAERGFIDLSVEGEAIGAGTLESWLDEPLSLVPDMTVRDALERHGSEPWIMRDQPMPDATTVHVPLRSALAPAAAPAGAPANPERYDFNMMFAHSFTGDLGERRLDSLSFVVFDTETTGLRPAAGDEIISIAGVRVANGRLLPGEAFESLVNPGRTIPRDSIRFHGITDDQVASESPIDMVLPRFHAFVGDAVLVAHNAAFDMRFLKLCEARCGVRFDNAVVDTLLLSLLVDGSDEDHSLDGMCERLNISIDGRHSALGDALATANALIHLLDRLKARGVHTFNDVMRATNMEDQLRARAHHF